MHTTAHHDPCNLIVNYIPTPVREDELQRLFEPFGPIASVRIIYDRENGNHPKGYGFVRYKQHQSAQLAMAYMNGYQISNKRLRVMQAYGPRRHAQVSDSPSVQSTGPRPTVSPTPSKVNVPCFSTGAVDQVAMPTAGLLPYRILHSVTSSAGVPAAVSQSDKPSASPLSTFAFMEGVPVQVIPAAASIMPAPVAGQQLVQTVPVTWAPTVSAMQAPVGVSEGDATSINAHSTNSPMELSMLSLSAPPVSAVTVPQMQPAQSPSQPQAFPPAAKPLEPVCFQPFISINPGSDGIVQSSVSSFFTPLGSSDVKAASFCGTSITNSTTGMLASSNFVASQ